MGLLPIPFRDYVPKLLQDQIDSTASGTALVTKADTHILEWKSDILEMFFFKLAERCPTKFLNELGDFISAGLNSFDTDSEKRIKIQSAVQRHKTRSTWKKDAKIIVDGVAGGDSSIVPAYFEAEWILWGQQVGDPADYTTTFGDDNVDDELGIDLIGTFDENNIPGIVWIDVDNDSLTADEVNRIVVSMEDDVAPAYFIVVLGYIHGVTGFFTPYANGTMG
jgi:hypothetical protein